MALLLGAATAGGSGGARREALAGPAPEITGPPEVIFDWSSDRCAIWDIPDTPPRAWRASDGVVSLVAGSEASRASRGSDLDALTRDCTILYRGAERDDPAAYDDRAWIHATWAGDDGEVIALAHVEYHGHERPDRCARARYMPCWRNAIVELVSRDGGRTFSRRPGGEALVAGLPYRYAGETQSARSGYFNPSNILRHGSHLYVFVFAEAYGAQRRGACLLRRPVDGGPDDWRAWDGETFSVRFVDPYREVVERPEDHVCAPVPGISSTITGVALHTPSGRYLAVTPGRLTDGRSPAPSGIYWLASDDLLSWTRPRLLYRGSLLWARDCADDALIGYPALLDENLAGDGGANGAADNFERIDQEFWLYLVRMRVDAATCRITADRDIVRLPVSWHAP